MKFSITEFDVIFLSYDEQNAERHWSDLIEKAPWAKRVHGVKGFDTAHRACAELSETDWFITVDADNIVRQEFFDIEVSFDPETHPRRCFSWNGLNGINGLAYGNGGLKLWSKAFVMDMHTHENANDPRKAVDFCWEADYQQVYRTYSDVWNNCTPYQAFRVGFREGVKLSLNRGCRVTAEMMKLMLHEQNLRNLRIWSCVGAHIENGLWAMFGARSAWRNMCDPTWDHTVVRDYDWFQDVWPSVADTDLVPACEQLGQEITQMTKIGIPVLTEETSAFFRAMTERHE